MKFKYDKATIAFIMLTTFCCISTNAQQKTETSHFSKFQAGAEVQWYPAGWLIGPVANYLITPKHIINFRAAVNIINRHNWSGLNDDERGTGYGGSVGYRFLLNPSKSTLFLGARVDLFNTRIKWKNDIGTPQQSSGSTATIVLQPSVESGYWIKLKKSKWNLLFAGGIGEEINIKTKGKEVGQGGLWLLSCSLLRSI
ncbi:MAG TPA: hypothetical protein VF939_03345 [Puia sp.]